MNNLRILLSPEDMALLRALHRKSEADKVEYMFMGGAVREGSDFVVRTLVFPKQEVSAGYVEGVGAPTWMKDIQGAFPVWIHTHLCQAFWSSTDEKTITSLVPSTKPDDPRLRVTVSIVLGYDKYLGRVDVHNPLSITIDDVPVQELVDAKIDKVADRRLDGMAFGKYSTRSTVVGGHWYKHSMESFGEEEEWQDWRKKSGYLV